MVHIFDGREFAKAKLEKLKSEVGELLKKGVKPVLASIIVGEDPASKLYVGLKKKAGESIGIGVQVISLSSSISKEELIQIINNLNFDEKIYGIMVQLPLPGNFTENSKEEILDLIKPNKDVDELGKNSQFVHPTSKAVLEVLNHALNLLPLKTRSLKVCVVGATGMVGVPLIRELRGKNSKLCGKWIALRHSGECKRLQNLQFEVLEADSKTENLMELTKKADILISCVGIPGIIKPDMVKEGSILIDVGAPIGDIQKDCYSKASFVSPVPGGIGPATIVNLVENLINSAQIH